MPQGEGTYKNPGRPSNKRTGEDFLDREQKKKFNYKEEKSKLDASTASFNKEMLRLKQERLKKEAKKKREADAKKFVEAKNKKRLEQHGFKQKETKAVYVSKGKAVPVNKSTAVQLKHKAVRKKKK